VGKEKCRLGAAGAKVGMGYVVAAAYEASVGGTDVVTREVFVGLICTFCGLLVLAVIRQ